jgi:hypothetical protein
MYDVGKKTIRLLPLAYTVLRNFLQHNNIIKRMDNIEETTIDHEEIKTWIEKNSGHPAVIENPNVPSERKSLRVDFRGEKEEKDLSSTVVSKRVNWKEFFEIFEKQKLAFSFEKTPSSDITWAYRFVKRENIENENSI